MRLRITTVLAFSLAGCVSPVPSAAPTPFASPGASVGPSAPPASAEPSPSKTPAASAETPSRVTLHVGDFVRVVVSELNVRVKPSTSAPRVNEPRGLPPLQFGPGTDDGVDDLFILDGPVRADGYQWWLVFATEYYWTERNGKVVTRPLPFPQNSGWVAAGNSKQDWLVPIDDPCPGGQVDIAQLTTRVASWAVRLGCFPGQTLTLRAWFDNADVLPAVFPERRSWESARNWDRLDFRTYPESLELPAPEQWVELVGQFDHPSSQSCAAAELLNCRTMFTITAIRGLGP